MKIVISLFFFLYFQSYFSEDYSCPDCAPLLAMDPQWLSQDWVFQGSVWDCYKNNKMNLINTTLNSRMLVHIITIMVEEGEHRGHIHYSIEHGSSYSYKMRMNHLFPFFSIENENTTMIEIIQIAKHEFSKISLYPHLRYDKEHEIVYFSFYFDE